METKTPVNSLSYIIRFEKISGISDYPVYTIYLKSIASLITFENPVGFAYTKELAHKFAIEASKYYYLIYYNN